MMLDDIRVVEMGQALAGPWAGEILATLGADVVKVEQPGTGDDCRQWGPPFWGGEAAVFHAVNGNKKSIALDAKDPQGRENLLKLLGGADVFLHNMRPGALDRMELGQDFLAKMFPRLVYGEIGAYGHKGPLSTMPAYEMLGQAFGGIMSITGEKDGKPVRCGPSICDFGSGMWLAIGILAALHERARTGKGGVVQTSLFETALNWSMVSAGSYFASGEVPQRMGTGHHLVSPYGYFETRTQPMVLACNNDKLFGLLADALGQTEWPEDDRFKDSPSRTANKALLEGMVAEILKTEEQRHWLDLFNKAGIPCAPMNTIPEAIEHPQAKALGIVQTDPGNPEVSFIGLPISLNGKRPGLRSGAPALGSSPTDIWD